MTPYGEHMKAAKSALARLEKKVVVYDNFLTDMQPLLKEARRLILGIKPFAEGSVNRIYQYEKLLDRWEFCRSFANQAYNCYQVEKQKQRAYFLRTIYSADGVSQCWYLPFENLELVKMEITDEIARLESLDPQTDDYLQLNKERCDYHHRLYYYLKETYTRRKYNQVPSSEWMKLLQLAERRETLYNIFVAQAKKYH